MYPRLRHYFTHIIPESSRIARWFHPIIISLLFTTQLFAQVNYLKGSVTDLDTSQPLVGINVIVVSHPNGAATDAKGRFLIEGLDQGSYTLMISAIGYETSYVKTHIPAPEIIQVKLKETFFQMESVVVTGTRSEKIHLNTPIATEVITTQDIQDSGARDLGELLEQRAGVSVSSSVEGGTIVNVLGMDSKYVMILIDGQPVTGKFNNRDMLDQVTISNIEKVEIVKGPGSSLYGSEAMGGVINIITRSEQSLLPLTIKVRHSDRLDSFNPLAKDLGQRSMLLGFNQKYRNLSVDLNADVQLANVDKSIQHIDVDDFQIYSLRSRLKYNPSIAHEISLDGSAYQSFEHGSASLLLSETETSRYSSNLHYSWNPNEALDLNVIARGANYMRKYDQTRPWGEILRDEETQEHLAELELNGIFNRDRFILNLGTELSQNTYISDRVSGGKQNVGDQAVFVQLEIIPVPQWTVVGGIRWDNSSDFSSVVNPRLALMYAPAPRWKFRFSAGGGYRKPSFMDRYIDWNHQQFGYSIQGNPELDPERSVGLTAGADYYHPSKYQASLFIYGNQFSDMIVDSLLQPGLFTYVNVEKVNYAGLELKVRYSINSRWLSSWSYTYSLNRNASTNEVIPNLPNHSGTISFTYKHPRQRWSAAMKLKAVAGYAVDEFIVLSQQLELSQREGYLMFDVDGHYNITPWLKTSAGLKNVLDETDERYGPFFGRTLYIELQTKLKGN